VRACVSGICVVIASDASPWAGVPWRLLAFA
jgi:hypothetical protein